MMKKLLLSFVLSAIFLSGCITFQIMPPATTQTTGTEPAILVFSSNPSTINAGGTSTLLWNVTGATSVSIDRDIGQVAIAGSMAVSPAGSTVYTISATGTGGTVTRSATVTVAPSASSSPSSPSAPAQSSPQWSPAAPAFSVTGATAGTEPGGRTGCFTLYANITANGPGTVSYVWESTEGSGYSYTWTIKFTQAGTQKVTLPAEMSMLPSGNYRLRVLSPNDLSSNPTYYKTCQ